MSKMQIKPFIKWYFGSLKAALKQPHKFFLRSFQNGFSPRDIWFGAICLIWGLGWQAASEIWFIGLSEQTLLETPHLVERFSQIFSGGPDMVNSFVAQIGLLKVERQITLVLLPFVAVFSIYLFAGILHVSLKALGMGPTIVVPYERTLQVVSYAQAPMVLAPIPLLGPIVAPLWVVVLLFLGIKKLHPNRFASRFASIAFPALMLKMLWASSIQVMAMSISDEVVAKPELSEIADEKNSIQNFSA